MSVTRRMKRRGEKADDLSLFILSYAACNEVECSAISITSAQHIDTNEEEGNEMKLFEIEIGEKFHVAITCAFRSV